MDPTQERIKYYTEWIKILWLIVAIVGGVIGLLLGPAWSWKIWVVVAGSIVAGALLFFIILLHTVVEGLIKRKEGTSA